MGVIHGSLREGMYNYDRYLKGRVLSNTKGYVKGSLHEIKGVVYPALVSGDDLILGEIMEIKEDDILTELDELEGFISEGHIDNEYDKVMLDIYNESHEIIKKLPVYVFNMNNPKHQGILGEPIETHDYVAHMKQKGQI